MHSLLFQKRCVDSIHSINLMKDIHHLKMPQEEAEAKRLKEEKVKQSEIWW